MNKVKVSGFGDANRTRWESGIRRLAVACARRAGQPQRQAASCCLMCGQRTAWLRRFPPTPSPDGLLPSKVLFVVTSLDQDAKSA